MLPSFFLLLILCGNTARYQTTWASIWTATGTAPPTSTTTKKTSSVETTNETPPQVVATPDYPVAAGQRVNLHCSSSSSVSFVWSWQRWENHNWTDVSNGSDLTLTKPEESGIYRCHAANRLSQWSESPPHTVFIISMHVTVGERLGIAAFVLSLLALIISLALLFWLGWQSLGDSLTTSNPAAKGVTGPEKSPKGGLPKADTDGDVYINYTSTNHAYTDLDPTNMTTDNVYASLS